MQRLLEIPQEVYDFLRNFRLRAGDLNREGGSKTAPFTHPLPGVHAPLAGISILQQTLCCCSDLYPAYGPYRETNAGPYTVSRS